MENVTLDVQEKHKDVASVMTDGWNGHCADAHHDQELLIES